MSYECHITVPFEFAATAEKISELGKKTKWKTSAIHGDPVLGKKAFFYLTCHSKTMERISAASDEMLNFLHNAKIPIIRRKIELIVLDEHFMKAPKCTPPHPNIPA